jgi:DNA repair exonuclease SbcCD nuclease subunit
MKVIIVGDLHLSHQQPISRLDSYIETCIYDLKEVLRVSKEQNVDSVLFLGDIFDVWKVSPELIPCNCIISPS